MLRIYLPIMKVHEMKYTIYLIVCYIYLVLPLFCSVNHWSFLSQKNARTVTVNSNSETTINTGDTFQYFEWAKRDEQGLHPFLCALVVSSRL